MAGKDDDPRVIKFMALFRRLRNMIGDEPAGLADLAADDEPLRRLCDELSNASFFLSASERTGRNLFIAPVDPKFIEAWRDYEERYEGTLAGIFLTGLGLNLDEDSGSGGTQFDSRWDYEDHEAKAEADALDTAMDFARTETDSLTDSESADYSVEIDRGVQAWTRLQSAIGIDLRGVFRRRALTPFILIPRYVSNKYGLTDKLSLVTHLAQAHQAFIFGAPFAAIAMMRSILEIVLKKHYRSTGAELYQLIDNCRTLPAGAPKEKLHRLRHLANDVLHFDNVRYLPPRDMEKELIGLLINLRALIEAAPNAI